MFEPVSDAKFLEDGCRHMSEAEMQACSEMGAPTEFDVTKAPNHYLDIPYGPLPEQLLDIYLPEEGQGPSDCVKNRQEIQS
jgi:hypothetical protein